MILSEDISTYTLVHKYQRRYRRRFSVRKRNSNGIDIYILFIVQSHKIFLTIYSRPPLMIITVDLPRILFPLAE